MADTATAEAPVEEKPVKVKEPVNPQVPAEYKNPETGKYKPGQDARHTSDVAKRIINGEDEQKALNELGSDTLRAKASRQVDNYIKRLQTTGEPGTVESKNSSFPARKVRGGTVNYEDEKGWHSVEADSKIGKTFVSDKQRDADRAEAEAAGMAEDNPTPPEVEGE